MELFAASKQWAIRPDDERFDSIQSLYDATQAYRDSAREATTSFDTLRVQADADEIMLVGKREVPARMAHWAFGQLAQRAAAPAAFLRELPATLACQVLNHRIKTTADNKTVNLLLHKNGSYLVRAFTSDKYSRIWNSDVALRILQLQEKQPAWQLPPARPARDDQRGTRLATEADVLRYHGSSLSVNVGDVIAPAGAYASDHDLFVFLVDESRRINDGTPEGLARGFFVSNSEVGAAAFRLTTFLYRHVCGNHIVWDAKGVSEIRVRHIGDANLRAWYQVYGELQKYSEASVLDDEARIADARSFVIAKTKDEVLDVVFGLKAGLTRSFLSEAYEEAERNVSTDGAPNTAWGLAQGITRLSQTQPFGDERTAVDVAAGRVLRMAF